MADEASTQAASAAPAAVVEATPAQESAAPAEQATEGAASAAETVQAQQPAEADIWARLAEVDPDELIQNHPRLQGKLGALAQKQAQKDLERFKSDWQQEQDRKQAAAEAKRKRDELTHLAQTDSEALAKRWMETATEDDYNDFLNAKYQEWERGALGKYNAEIMALYQDEEVREAFEAADDATKAKMWWENYQGQGSLAKLTKAITEVVADRRAEKRAEARAEELYRARAEAARRDGAAEAAARDAAEQGRPDLNLSSGVPGGRIFSNADVAAMSLADYLKNEDVIEEQRRLGVFKIV